MNNREDGTTPLLDRVDSPADIRRMSRTELALLAEEIRRTLIQSVSRTGGHIASNLGVVELTLALHHVFESPEDAIVWDVGHQSYVHKMVTGRKDRMSTLRKADGLSGFPKRSESEHDLFNTGHSSTSISAALGIARARSLAGRKGHAIAVIGDGALTGGMALEALNDAGTCHSNLIVILNDNGMSIDRNVGALSHYLGGLRMRPGYFRLRNFFRRQTHRFEAGSWFRRLTHRIRFSLKSLTVPSMFFEDMGFRYFGPVEGHSLDALIDALSHLRTLSGPILLHVATQKGRGYQHAEEQPEKFHGISAFRVETGQVIKCSSGTWSECFGDALLKLAGENPSVVAVTAAMPEGTGLNPFRAAFPSRYFDVGIAEQHAVTMAAGMAAEGMTPVCAIYSTFLQRAYDQILHDVCLQNLHVVLAVDRAGVVGDDGETHQGLFDLSFLSEMPNMTVLAPTSDTELARMLRWAVRDCTGPVAIRYPRGCAATAVAEEPEIRPGTGVLCREGTDVAILAAGVLLPEALLAADLLQEQGISAAVVNPRFIKPIDAGLLERIALETGALLTVEDNTVCGGFGGAVAEHLANAGIQVALKIAALPDMPIEHGTRNDILARHGLDAAGIAASAAAVSAMRRTVPAGR